ncbi:site-2 protease family protein [Candidatus Uhrbacteria bacterium]|nr:site-2 protease family protein [Candidatus Uhrbacteria bacterium]
MQESIAPLLPYIVGGAAILISITIHEFSHGLAAYLQGDNTARDAGRLTLNPIAHIDPIGTILLPAILILTRAPFLIGWARPVPFNPLNLRNQRYGPLYVGLAGPLANAALFTVSGVLLNLFVNPLGGTNFLVIFLSNLFVINIVLAVFNLIPIPPLDGSKILAALLPPRLSHISMKLEIYGPYILLFLLFIEFTIHPFIGSFIFGAIRIVSRLFGI